MMINTSDSVADCIGRALEMVSESVDQSLVTTQEMPAICGDELALSTYFSDDELVLHTWEHAMLNLGEEVDLADLDN